MYNFDPYNVLLSIATNIAYDCFCAPGSHMFAALHHVQYLFMRMLQYLWKHTHIVQRLYKLIMAAVDESLVFCFVSQLG